MDQQSRRDFLARLAKAGAAVALTAYVGDRFARRGGPRCPDASGAGALLPDFSVRGMAGKMSIVTGTDRVKNLNLALTALGGIGAFVKAGDRVLLKVNAAFAVSPILSATTHPELVAEMTRLCYQAGAASVIVTDNPINDPANCFTLTGIGRAAEGAGAKVMLPRAGYFKPFTVRGAELIRDWPVLLEPFDGVTKVIGMAPAKDHNRSGASMTLKNWYGLLGGRRNLFHQDIHNLIKELALMVKPTLVILDGTMTMMTNGPTGGSLSDLKPTRTMVAGTDPVAVDAFGVTLLGRQASDLPYLAKAAAAGAGTASYELLNPIRIQAG